MANLIGQVLHNQFRVDEFIASGGMGSVYKVWDLKRSVPLAMKVLHADLMDDSTLFKSFQREARALQKLHHPNIVPFYGLYQTEQFAFLLEHYIDGPSLRDALKKHPKGMPIPEALAYMQALCAALGYAHAGGVIHCDIKPGNIMIDRGNQIYLADFGIARHADSSTTTIAGSGTPAYMAPEQIRAEPVTPATDIYALGILLYEMLTGQRPFRGDDPETSKQGNTSGERIVYGHLNLQPRNPSEVNPSIPESISEAIMKALSKSPQERFASTIELLEALQLDNSQGSYQTQNIQGGMPPIKPSALQTKWLVSATVLAFVIAFSIWLANVSASKSAPTVDLEATFLMKALTDVRITLSAVAHTSTPDLPAITETPVPTNPAPPTASPTSQPHVSMVEAERVEQFSNLASLASLAEENYTLSDFNRLNETLKFTVNLDKSQAVAWKAVWCAKTKSLLNDNLANIEIEFFLGGEKIPFNQFVQKSYINKDGGELNNWNCTAYWTVLKDWEPGTYEVITKFTFLEFINDGKYDYQPGWQASLYNVAIK